MEALSALCPINPHRLDLGFNTKLRSRKLFDCYTLRSYRLGDFLSSDRVPQGLGDGGCVKINLIQSD